MLGCAVSCGVLVCNLNLAFAAVATGDLLRSLAAQGHSVKNVEEYRQHAAECRQLAKQALTRTERDQLLELATTWERLANDRLVSLPTRPDRTGQGRNSREPTFS